jgi:hypothetical protein
LGPFTVLGVVRARVRVFVRDTFGLVRFVLGRVLEHLIEDVGGLPVAQPPAEVTILRRAMVCSNRFARGGASAGFIGSHRYRSDLLSPAVACSVSGRRPG